MLDSNLRQQLQAHLQRISHPVELVAHLDDTEASRELGSLLTDVASLSSLIRLETRRAAGPEGQVRTPSFSVARAGSTPRIRYAGLPMGHEFTSFVLSLLQAGGHPPRLPDGVAERVQALEGEFEFEVYVSLSCQNCPEVVQALNAMAALSPRIRSTMIDGALFGAEIDARRVMAVPAVYLNGQPFGHGRMTAEEILAKLDAGNPARHAAALDAKDPFDVLVVGGGPAGAAAAIYAARKGIRTGLVAERFGGQVMDTMGIENFISVTETEGPRLAAALEEHVRTYEVDVMNLQRATALHPADESGLATVELASGARLRSRAVILATGARWREMNVPGEREYRGHGVAYCPHCDGPLFKGKRVAVVGGGNSGVEAAIDLAGIVAHVTLIEFDGRLRADEVLQRKLRSLPNVRVLVAAETREVHGADGRVTGLSYRDRGNGAHHRLDLEGVFVQIGLVPNTDWLRGAVALNPRGEIETDARGGTSAPGVFAAGDATAVPYKQIIVAMGEGSKAALGAFDHLMRLPVAASAPLAA
ncbi:MAG TPA: alkyl hydroperoxide reductase subunit F [Steroidobacteraceae bacterium]|nr:alkyl hydroperoxide reductase subunit F [Steroidobacteraceae bacterium]